MGISKTSGSKNLIAHKCARPPPQPPPRKGEGLRDLRRLAQLRELLQHHLALQPRQMVDEENAFQMVVLVLDARRHQPGHALLMMLAVLVLPVEDRKSTRLNSSH